MPSPIQNIETRLTALEAKIDQIIATPTMPPEVNLTQLTEMLSQILSLCGQINSNVAPQINTAEQVQQAIASLQQLQAQLQQQAQAIVIPEPLNPEPLIPEVL
jgi:hypothetical protein